MLSRGSEKGQVGNLPHFGARPLPKVAAPKNLSCRSGQQLLLKQRKGLGLRAQPDRG
jgi:hypothetical protein